MGFSWDVWIKERGIENILFRAFQYRPQALLHYTRDSCVEICHIARKFHKKNTFETLM